VSDLRILSLGAGVQSSTVALMMEKGLIEKCNAAVFSDTKSEPKAVMEWLNWLKNQVSFPIYIESKGDLRKDTMDYLIDKQFSLIPVFTKSKSTGKKGMSRRQCTNHYKVQVVVKKTRELLGLKPGQRRKDDMKVEMVMGISRDEPSRMRTNKLSYITNVYPLVDLGMTRKDCLEWMQQQGYPKPPRSACTYCPFHSIAEWKEIKKNKDEWQDVVELDHFIRDKSKNGDDELYLNAARVPMEDLDLDGENQIDLFMNECEGACGV
tara:strand:- start:72 stop:866 length:795 start_codon:yes stop_codon:yes gene_type:complete